MKGLNELMLGELSERLRVQRTGTHWLDPRCLRTAITSVGLFLCHAGSHVVRTGHWRAGWWRDGRRTAAVCACFSYYVLMWIGRAGRYKKLCLLSWAWLPNAVFALVWLALTAVTARRQSAARSSTVG